MAGFLYGFASSAILTFSLVLCVTCFPYGRNYSATIFMFNGSRITTESPDNVEVFDPESWTPKFIEKQVKVEHLLVETKVRLRFARTRINIRLSNPHEAPLQATFKIMLPKDAFFTTFKLRLDKQAKQYTAKIESKEKAREMVYFANVKTNGTVSAALIESSDKEDDIDLQFYDMKFTLGNQSEVQAFAIFERQLSRKEKKYCDEMKIHPLEDVMSDLVEMTVDVEEFENITSLGCSPKLKKHSGGNCASILKHKKNKQNTANFSWRKSNVLSSYLEHQPLGFCYQLEQKDSISAALIAQSDTNYYVVHLFVPENLPPIRKHLVFVLDVSDSMFGNKLEQLKWSMIEILDDISPDDYFSIITFSSQVSVWSYYAGDRSKCPLPFPAYENIKDSARKFILEITPSGMTNIYKGLVKAFDIIKLFSPLNDEKCEHEEEIKTPKKVRQKTPTKLPENVESMIIFLSDGVPTIEPTDGKAMLHFFRKLNQNNMSNPVQIHTVAYGGDADVHFLKALSLENNGAWKIIRNESNAGVELVNFYDEISSQVLTKIQHSYYTIDDDDNNDNHYLVPPNDSTISSSLLLYDEGEIINVNTLVNVSSNDTAPPAISANLRLNTEVKGRNGYLQFDTPVHDCISLQNDMPTCLDRIEFYLKRLQGYQNLQQFLERDLLVQEGYLCPKSFREEDIYISVNRNDYDYNSYDADSDCVNPYKEKVIELAKEYGFITPYTSFILTTELFVDIGLKENALDGLTLDDESEGGSINAPQLDEETIPLDGKLESNLMIVNDSVARYEDYKERPDAEGWQRGASKNDTGFIWFTKSVREFATSLFDRFFKPRKNAARSSLTKGMESLNFVTDVEIGLV